MAKIIKILLLAGLLLTMGLSQANGAGIFSDSGISGLEAQGVVAEDQDTGTILYTKNAQKRMYPASTTKILTALVALENGELDDIVTVGKEITYIDPQASKAGLFVGQRISLKNLIRALLLPSGSDAAHAIAVYIGRKTAGDEHLSSAEAGKVFIKLMNQRARDLGAKNSHFVNPDGLHDPNHYTTPSDLALIAREAMKKSFFRQVAATESYLWDPGPVIQSAVRGQAEKNVSQYWENTNQLIHPDSPFYSSEVTGIKTGYTSQAGYCLATSATREGRNILIVVLNSTETGVWQDTLKILNYSFDREANAETSQDLKTAGGQNVKEVAGVSAPARIEQIKQKGEQTFYRLAVFWPLIVLLGLFLFTLRLVLGNSRKPRSRRRG